MRPKWPKLASLAQQICTLQFQFFGALFSSKKHPFKNIFDFTTAGDLDCVAALERLPDGVGSIKATHCITRKPFTKWLKGEVGAP